MLRRSSTVSSLRKALSMSWLLITRPSQSQNQRQRLRLHLPKKSPSLRPVQYPHFSHRGRIDSAMFALVVFDPGLWQIRRVSNKAGRLAKDTHQMCALSTTHYYIRRRPLYVEKWHSIIIQFIHRLQQPRLARGIEFGMIYTQ